MMKMLSWVRCAILACVLGLVGYQDASTQSPQNVHPMKAAFADAETWPAVAPGQIPLRNFEPFRGAFLDLSAPHGCSIAGRGVLRC